MSMNLKKHIPNILTLLNLFCGCVALVFVAQSLFYYAFFFVCLGIFFDFFDGFLARKFGVAGPLGVQLDSLADMVTSGVVPGFAMYKMLLIVNNPLHTLPNFQFFNSSNVPLLPFLGFVITLGACYRLANFNIDTRQSDSFIGLPTPANTLFVMSLPIANIVVIDRSYMHWVLLAITFLSTYVMNAEIPLFSLKIKDFSFQKYKLQIGFLIASLVLLFFLQITAVPVIIVMYVLLSVVNNTILAKK